MDELDEGVGAGFRMLRRVEVASARREDEEGDAASVGQLPKVGDELEVACEEIGVLDSGPKEMAMMGGVELEAWEASIEDEG